MSYIQRVTLGVSVLVLSVFFVLPVQAQYNTQTFLSSIDGGTGKQAENAYLDEPNGFDFAGSNLIFIADTSNNVIEKINRKSGKLKRVAGTHEYGYVDGAAKQAQFAKPADLTVRGKKGKQIFVADTENHVVRKIEGGNVSTLPTGELRFPSGVLVSGKTLYISDTGNNRILAVSRDGGTPVVLADSADGVNSPTKLCYRGSTNSLIFANNGEETVRAVNVKTGNVSAPLISGLEEIGGIDCFKRTVYVASSYSIGVFNEIWKIRLPKKNNTAISTKRISHTREVESLNNGSDIAKKTDTLEWEELYTWDRGLLFEEDFTAGTTSKKTQQRLQQTYTEDGDAIVEVVSQQTKEDARTLQKKGPLECVQIKKPGDKRWKNAVYTRVKSKKPWQQQNVILKKKYQGDLPFFRVGLEYDNKNLSDSEREEQREANQSDTQKGIAIQSVTQTSVDAPTNLTTTVREPRAVTVAWDAVDGATSYDMHFFKGDTRQFSRQGLTTTSATVKEFYLQSNQAYAFWVRSCNDEGCGDWSELYEFRTPPAAVREISDIKPLRGTNITKLPNGNFRATLKFKTHTNKKRHNMNNLRAQIELCSKYADHPETVEAERLFVLYKGGSSILSWRANGTRPEHYAGKHRFQDDFGKKERALVGRPKTVAISSDGTFMYISQNNKITKYDFVKKKLTRLAGHVMDSYTEGKGEEVRFSDVVDMTLSPDNKWLYLADRNNHRIRKLNTKTGKSKYLTGAGGTNFSFETRESNGYQEGGPCKNEFEFDVKGCAYFNRPTGIAISPDGNTLYVAEGSNHRVRAVDAKTGVTRLIAGNGTAGFVNGTGGAAQFNGPYTVDVSGDGKLLFVADKFNHAVRAIDLSNNNVTTVFGNGKIGLRDGSFEQAVLAIPEYLREENGMLYWSEAGSHTIRSANLSTRQVQTISGNGKRGFNNGFGASAEWNNPKGMDVRYNKLYVADYSNDLIRTVEF